MPQPASPPVAETYPRLALIEARLGESLSNVVDDRRAKTISWSRIAAELHQRTGLYITGEAIRLWHTRERAV